MAENKKQLEVGETNVIFDTRRVFEDPALVLKNKIENSFLGGKLMAKNRNLGRRKKTETKRSGGPGFFELIKVSFRTKDDGIHENVV